MCRTGKQLEPGANASKIFSDRYIRADNYPTLKARKAAKALQEAPKSEEEQKALLSNRIKKLQKQNEKLEKLGISYKFAPKKLMKARKAKQAKVSENAAEVKTAIASPKVAKIKTPVSAKVTPTQKPAVPLTPRSTVSVTNGTPKPKKSKTPIQVTPKTSVASPASNTLTPNKKTPKQKSPVVKKPSPTLIVQKSAPTSPATTPKSPKNKKNKRKSADVSVVDNTEAVEPSAATPTLSPKVLKNLQKQSPQVALKGTKMNTRGTPVTDAKSPAEQSEAADQFTGKKGKLGKRKSDTPVSETPNKKSPKLKQATPTAAEEKPEQIAEAEEAPKGRNARKSLQLPKVSPKVLRSKMRQSESALTPVAKKQASPKAKQAKQPIAEETQASPQPAKKTKFSPKLLRSRKNQTVEQSPAPSVDPSSAKAPIGKNKGKKAAESPKVKPETPKFSPKLLRSKAQRHSDDLTTGLQSAVKQQIKGRKSMK